MTRHVLTSTLTGIALLSGGCTSFELEPQPATPQRPTLSSGTTTTAPGTFELEAGALIDPNDRVDLPLTLKWGMSEDAELFAGGSPYQEEERPGTDASGVGDTVVGLRYRFLEEAESVPAAALQLATKLPTGDEDEGLSTGEIDFLAAGILSKKVGDVDGVLFYQLGILGEPDEGDTDIQHSIAVAGSVPLGEDGEWSMFAELAAVEVPERDFNSIFTTAGFTYAVSKDFVLDVGVVVGLNHDAEDFQVVFGLTKNFGGPGLGR